MVMNAIASVTIKLTTTDGLHMRPIMMVVDLCNNFHCDVSVSNASEPEIKYDAKSIMQLSMIIEHEFIFEANGQDANSAIQQIKSLFDAINFGGDNFINEHFQKRD